MLESHEARDGHLAAPLELDDLRVDIFEFLPIACFALDREGCIVQVNAAGRRLIGDERRLIVGERFARAARLADPSSFSRHLDRCFEARDPVGAELVVRAAGALLTMQATSLPRRPGERREALVYLALVDVTEQVRSIERLNAFRGAIDSVIDYAIVMLDPTGLIASWNDGARALYGCGAEAVLGTPLSSLLATSAGAASDVEALLLRASATGRACAEMWHVRRDGALFFAHAVVTPLRTGCAHHGFALVVRDLSSRKETEAHLDRSLAAVAGARGDKPAGSVSWIAEHMTAWGEDLGLTPSETLVAELLLLGLSNKEIARARGVSDSTIRAHVSACLRKTGVPSRGELAFHFFTHALERSLRRVDGPPPGLARA